MNMEVSIIVAIAQNGVIGREGHLPWHLYDDLQRFKSLTMNHMVIMGRKTWESIGKPLPGREMVVVSRNCHVSCDKVQVVSSLEDAIQFAKDSGKERVFVMGGAEIYGKALSYADRMYLTFVHATVDGDTYFNPQIDQSWKVVVQERKNRNDRNDYDFTFAEFEKCKFATEDSLDSNCNRVSYLTDYFISSSSLYSEASREFCCCKVAKPTASTENSLAMILRRYLQNLSAFRLAVPRRKERKAK